jgi:hypothetical protein
MRPADAAVQNARRCGVPGGCRDVRAGRAQRAGPVADSAVVLLVRGTRAEGVLRLFVLIVGPDSHRHTRDIVLGQVRKPASRCEQKHHGHQARRSAHVPEAHPNQSKAAPHGRQTPRLAHGLRLTARPSLAGLPALSGFPPRDRLQVDSDAL